MEKGNFVVISGCVVVSDFHKYESDALDEARSHAGSQRQDTCVCEVTRIFKVEIKEE